MGGSSKSTTELPAYLEDAVKNALTASQNAASVGYMPWMGPDVAAMTPTQVAAMQNTNTGLSSFGMASADPMAGMPTAQNYGGMGGYSSFPIYDEAMKAWAAANPQQAAAYQQNYPGNYPTVK